MNHHIHKQFLSGQFVIKLLEFFLNSLQPTSFDLFWLPVNPVVDEHVFVSFYVELFVPIYINIFIYYTWLNDFRINVFITVQRKLVITAFLQWSRLLSHWGNVLKFYNVFTWKFRIALNIMFFSHPLFLVFRWHILFITWVH